MLLLLFSLFSLFTYSQKDNFCSSITEIYTDKEEIYLIFSEFNNLEQINSSLFSFYSSYGRDGFYFPPGTCDIEKISNNTIKLHFDFPFISFFKGSLICNYKNNNEKVFPVTLETTEFSNSNYSQLKCYNKDFETRWCEGRNIGYVNHSFIFYSPAQINFPDPFIVPGARAPPFDDNIQRISFILSNTKIPTKNITINNNISYVYGTFFNMHMLWHTIFDFVVPFLTFTLYYSPVPSELRHIYVHRVTDFFFNQYLVSMGNVHRIDDIGDVIFKNVTIGIEKFENNPYSWREYDDSISFEYDYKKVDNTGELREKTLEKNNISTLAFGYKNKPLIIFIDRNTEKRNITNIKDVLKCVFNIFSDCEIMLLDLEIIPLEKQLYYFGRASVIIGVHGSGLTNVVWMKESSPHQKTHLIEFLPLKYNCRNWFKTASLYAGVNYHSIESNQTIFRESKDTKRCRNKSEQLCAKLECHDLLRDQDITVPIDKFQTLLTEIHDDLKDTNTYNEYALHSI